MGLHGAPTKATSIKPALPYTSQLSAVVYLKCLGPAARHFWLLVAMLSQDADEHQGQPALASGREEGPGASGGSCQAAAELDPDDVGGTYMDAYYAVVMATNPSELHPQLRRVAEMLQAQRQQDQQAAQQPAQQVVCGYEADVSGGESE